MVLVTRLVRMRLRCLMGTVTFPIIVCRVLLLVVVWLRRRRGGRWMCRLWVMLLMWRLGVW